METDDIRDWPAAERPRERLARGGPAALSDRELLAVVLGTGPGGGGVLAQAARVFDALGGREGLARAEMAQLSSVRGVGPGTAARVVAALELGRRCLLPATPRGAPIRGPADLKDALIAHLGGVPREVLGVFMLDARMRLIGFRRVSEGTVFSTPASTRAVFERVLGSSAAAVILAHNHPSGDPTPSVDDIEATKRLVAAGAALEIPVLDHLILGGATVVSLKELGHIS